MIRTIITPDTSIINLTLPAEYIGEEVEILVFPVNGSVNFQEPVYSAEAQGARRQEAFQNFMKYKGTLPADFDYKTELAEYRDERYGHIN